MILECPSCQARFLVADALIPPAGRTVRCGACSNQWFVELAPAAPPATETSAEQAPVAPLPPVQEAKVDFATLAENAAAAPEAAAPKLEGEAARKLPVVQKRRLPRAPFIIGASVLAASWLIVAFVAYFPKWAEKPGLRGIYAMVGATSTEGLVFDEISMERKKDEGGRTQFIIAGSVANHAAGLRRLPKVRVELKDKDGLVIWSRNYPVNHVIKPGEVYPFRIEDVQTSFATKVSTVVVDLGHSLEMAMR